MSYYDENIDKRTKRLREIKTAASGRDFTVGESDEIIKLSKEIEEFQKKQRGYLEMERFLGSAAPSKAGEGGNLTHFHRNSKTAREFGEKVIERFKTKAALIGAGTEPIPVDLLDEPALEPHQSSWSVWQLFQVEILDSPQYQYLRQTLRDNNAAIVKPGDLKPTSMGTFEAVRGELKVVAHLTDPMHSYWIKDFPSAAVALTEQMVHGLYDAQEGYLINGTGVDEPTGILNTSGINAQSFDTDMLTTTRSAVTTLEMLDHEAGAFVLHPQDWQQIELARDASGRLEFTVGPVDRTEKRLWGVPVAVSPRLTQGTGLLVDPSAVRLMSDGAYEVVATDNVGDDFARNQIRIRAEHRFGVAVTHPTGIVKMDLTA